MIRAVVLGQPFWGQRIASALAGPELAASFVGPREYASLLASVRGADRVVLMRAGYRVGSPTLRGRLFDSYWTLLRRQAPDAIAAHYWLGTDALNMIEDARDARLRWGPIRRAQRDLHLADAAWLVPELATVGLNAVAAPVPQPYPFPAVVPSLPERFSVLTYVPDARFTFYGGELILEAARQLPDVAFDIVGGTGTGIMPGPANVTWHGWVADMSARYSAATVVVRVPRHDGLGASVVEGLLHARHVVYGYDVPFTIKVDVTSADALIAALTRLRDAHESRVLTPNLDGRRYAIEAFDETSLTAELRRLLLARV